MLTSAPAIWSAIAATFSAIAAILILKIQRQNLLESVRPELVIGGWVRHERRSENPDYEKISFETIKNVGRGPALHVTLASVTVNDDRETALARISQTPLGDLSI